VRAFSFLGLAVTVLGCQSLERAEQCRSIAAQVNPTLDELDGHLAEAPRNWVAAEHELRLLVQRLSAVRLDEPKLERAASDLANNFTEARELAELAVQSQKQALSDDTVVQSWARIRERHANLVRGLSHYCRKL
jgi:uncharacterized coiled-coil protein SlyX